MQVDAAGDQDGIGIRTRIRHRLAMMVEHVRAIEGLLLGLQSALQGPDAASASPAQLKALQDISDILRECQQLAFANASDLIREVEGRSSDPGASAPQTG